MKTPHLPSFVQRLIIPVLMSVAIIGVTLPNVLRAQETRSETAHQTALIERHMRILNSPPAPNRYGPFASFTSSPEADAEILADTLQADLSRSLQAPDSRLIDLKRIDDRTDIAELTGLRYQAEIEGDLQAILGRIAALENLNHPLQLENLELSARGPNDRPDQRVRVSLTLTRWVEAVS